MRNYCEIELGMCSDVDRGGLRERRLWISIKRFRNPKKAKEFIEEIQILERSDKTARRDDTSGRFKVGTGRSWTTPLRFSER